MQAATTTALLQTSIACPDISTFFQRHHSSVPQVLHFQILQQETDDHEDDDDEYANINMLRPDTSVYCTAHAKNTTLVLCLDQQKHHSDSSFILTHVMAKAPENGFTCPLGALLVFVSHGMQKL